jgi:hypothetical protein
MTTQPPTNPELTAAIVKAAVIDAVLMGVGFVLYVVFGTIWGIVGAAILGGVVMMLLMAQAGAFGNRDERR